MSDLHAPGSRAATRPQSDAVHEWFGLTYSNYLVLARAYLQSMPDRWQERFVGCLRELDEAYWDHEHPAGYRVTAVDATGRFCQNPDPHYDRGRTFIPPLAPGGDPNV